MKTKVAMKFGFAGIIGVLAVAAMSAPSTEASMTLRYDAAPITVSATRTEISPNATAVFYEAPTIEVQSSRSVKVPAKAMSFYYEASPIHVRGTKPVQTKRGAQVAMITPSFASH